MPRITGIGGVFIKSTKDHKALAAWYEKHLGLKLEAWGGAALKWPDDKAEDSGTTAWMTAAPDSQWFAPSPSSFMINYRVEDLAGMIEGFKRDGIELMKGPEYHENGVFAWVMDPDGNKVELWEPKIWDDKNKRS
jgi:predicted enzyme related to lactoylglutathione lyase